jgi:hypothetical protein
MPELNYIYGQGLSYGNLMINDMVFMDQVTKWVKWNYINEHWQFQSNMKILNWIDHNNITWMLAIIQLNYMSWTKKLIFLKVCHLHFPTFVHPNMYEASFTKCITIGYIVASNVWTIGHKLFCKYHFVGGVNVHNGNFFMWPNRRQAMRIIDKK